MNGLSRSNTGLGPLQYSHSGSSTVPRAGPRRLARSVTTIALRPGRAWYCVRTATGRTLSIRPRVAVAPQSAKLCSNTRMPGVPLSCQLLCQVSGDGVRGVPVQAVAGVIVAAGGARVLVPGIVLHVAQGRPGIESEGDRRVAQRVR